MSRRDALHRIDELLDHVSAAQPLAQVEPALHPEERRKGGRWFERCSDTGQQDRDDPIVGLLGRSIEGDLQLLSGPVTDPAWSDEDQARVTSQQAVAELVLPVVA